MITRKVTRIWIRIRERGREKGKSVRGRRAPFFLLVKRNAKHRRHTVAAPTKCVFLLRRDTKLQRAAAFIIEKKKTDAIPTGSLSALALLSRRVQTHQAQVDRDIRSDGWVRGTTTVALPLLSPRMNSFIVSTEWLPWAPSLPVSFFSFSSFPFWKKNHVPPASRVCLPVPGQRDGKLAAGYRIYIPLSQFATLLCPSRYQHFVSQCPRQLCCW